MREATDVDLRVVAWFLRLVAQGLWLVGLVVLVLWLMAGRAHADDLVCEPVELEGVPMEPPPVPLAGPQHVAVVMATIDGRDSVTTPAEMSGAFDHLIEPYYAEVSRGQISVTHEMFGPVALSSHYDDFFRMCQDAIDAIDPFVDLHTVATVFVAGAYEGPWGGIGLVGMDFEWQTADGPVRMGCALNRSQYGPDTTAAIGTHELGHNFGSHHSGCCKSATPTRRADCGEYFNHFSAMGEASLMGHWDATQKQNSNFIAPGEVVTVTESGRYTIGAHEPPTIGPRLIRVRMTGDPLDDLLIEARTPYGFDAQVGGLFPGMDDGALLEVIDPFQPHPAKPMIFPAIARPCQGLLCECDDPGLPPGKTYTHPRGWSVTTVSRQGDQLVVDIGAPGASTTTTTISGSTTTTIGECAGCNPHGPNRGKLRGYRRRCF